MKLSLFLLFPLVCVLGYGLRRRWKQDRVSPAWLVENSRRQWTEGIDDVCWTWPDTSDKEVE